MRRGEAGFVLVVVLLLAGLMVVTAATYARHALGGRHLGETSLWVLESREAASSGVAWARQALAAGSAGGSVELQAGGRSVTVDIWDAGAERRGLRVDATEAGLGATVVGEAVVHSQPGSVLPALTAAAASLLRGDPHAAVLAGTQTLSGQTFPGTLVLAAGAQITLEDAVVQGCIVSAPALDGPPYAAGDAVRLVLRGGARVGPSALAAGVGIFLPDGELLAGEDCSIEVQGVIVAQALDLRGDGACDGHIAAVEPFVLPAGLDRPGLGRVPPPWPAALELSTFGVARLVFPRQAVLDSEVAGIQGFFGSAK